MEIRSFRIRNYRSINDSGDCYLSGDNVTILAGKNESGKTAILEALQDFNIEREIREEAIPINSHDAIPEIDITFEMNKAELTELFKSIGIKKSNIQKSNTLEITKKYPKQYILSQEFIEKIGLRDDSIITKLEREIEKHHKSVKETLLEFPQLGGNLPELDFENISTFQSKMQNLITATKPHLPKITDEVKLEDFNQALSEITDLTSEIENFMSAQDYPMNELLELIPNFILFSSFDDIFPSEILLSEAPSDDLIKDLDIISDLDLELISSTQIMQKTKHKEQLNLRIKTDYKKFWTQDLTNLHIEWDSEKLYFFIKENDDYFPPKIRSKGKQWHLAFYVRVSARSKENLSNVILIDEPGLFLHSKAQEDILKKLDDSATNIPIIFSTHSPYLIKIDSLNRIRLISRTPKKGTTISNKIHKGADKETLTPIITAIGLDLSRGLDIAKDNNAIFEGISDYYYLNAFKELLEYKFKKEVHFIPGVGAENSNFLAPLMIGWGLNYCVVLDNDKKGKQIKKKLQKNFGHTDIKILMVSKTNDIEIEDLFEKNDFLNFVINEEPDKTLENQRNSEIIKKYDKVVLSKKFFERSRTNGINLSETTKENFRNLLEEINKILFS